jgi:hypothetical protein
MEIRLRLYKKGDSRIVLRLPVSFRIVFALMGVVIAVATFAFGDPPPLGIAICVLWLIATVYDERWSFDTASGRAVFRFGTLPIALKKTYRIEGIRSFGIESFSKGSLTGSPVKATDAEESKHRFMRKRFSSLYMILATDEKVCIETVDAKRQAELQKAIEDLSELCDKPFIDHP